MNYYKIAGLIFAVDGADKCSYFDTHMSDYRIPACSNPDIHVFCRIYTEPLILPDNITVYHSGMFTYMEFVKDGESMMGYYSSVDNIVRNMIYFNADFTDVYIDLMHMDFEVDDPDGRRLFNSLGNAVEMGIIMHNRFVFHSSSISYKGKGLCFSAASGTGKSTHTGLWLDTFPEDTLLVNDDKPIIWFDKQNTWLCGTPWAGTTGLNTNVNVPLKAIVIIERGEVNELYTPTDIKAVHRIIKEAPKPVIPKLMEVFMSRINQFVLSAPIRCLKCTISPEAVYTVLHGLKLDQHS